MLEASRLTARLHTRTPSRKEKKAKERKGGWIYFLFFLSTIESERETAPVLRVIAHQGRIDENYLIGSLPSFSAIIVHRGNEGNNEEASGQIISG